jgi:MFS-type transporter involved in bile tolerance (Atg22 family)
MTTENPRGRATEARNGALGRAGWVLYQLAASPYFVIINIFVFVLIYQQMEILGLI